MTSEKLVVVLSDAAPIRISKSDWPVQARYYEKDSTKRNNDPHFSWVIKVMRHNDRRTIVMGRRFSETVRDEVADRELFSGYLSSKEPTFKMITSSIRKVASEIGRKSIAQSVIMNFTPRDI